jgi:predicted dehydrogenase
MSYRYGGISAPYIPMQEPLRVQDQHFVDCVLSGRRPQSDGESGLAVVRVLEAATQSLQRRGSTPVAPPPPVAIDARESVLTPPRLLTRKGA